MMREVKKFFFLGRIFLNLNKQDLTLHQFLCRNVFGLGSSMVKSFAARLGIPPMVSFLALPLSGRQWKVKLRQLEKLVLRKRRIHGKLLQRILNERMFFEAKQGSFRGFRYLQALPVRGQRTHTNARTQKRLFKAKSSVLLHKKGF